MVQPSKSSHNTPHGSHFAPPISHYIPCDEQRQSAIFNSSKIPIVEHIERSAFPARSVVASPFIALSVMGTWLTTGRVTATVRSAMATCVVLCCLSIGASDAAAQGSVDRVRTRSGTEAGEVEKVTPLEVTISKGSAGDHTIPVNEITSIIFRGEPAELTQARIHAEAGGYQNALDRLKQIEDRDLSRDFIRQDVKFYQAYCAAKLAIDGSGTIVEAGRQVGSFIRSHRESYHYLKAVELLGDLLMASRRFAQAESQYDELAKAPWPEYKARSAVLVGRALQAQEEYSKAIRQFDTALSLAGDAKPGESQRLDATLGKAICLTQIGRVDQGIQMIEDVVREADPEDRELHAAAYNALGRCYEKAGKTKDALLAFLHVDVLYSSVPDAHAEALSRLTTLWEAVGQEGRAREARQTLQEKYATSRWAE